MTTTHDPKIRQVVRRSAVKARSTNYGWGYTYTLTLEDGETLKFEGGWCNTEQKAFMMGIQRSQRAIDKGYQDGL